VERVVERVNPDYEAPPGTPEQLANAREAIRVALAAQAQARADATSAAKDRAVTRRRHGQLDGLDDNLGTLAERTTEQRQFTTSTATANREQQKRQESAGTDLTGSASRFAGMATLSVMLRGWADGASVAATIVGVFSDDGANKIRKSGGDARRFLSQLDRAKLVVDEQRERQPLRIGRLAGDQASLAAEGQRGAATDETNQRSVRQLALIRTQNSQDEQAAGQAEDRAQSDAAESGRTAADLRGRHDQLSAALQAWAQRHAEQRRVAVAQTSDRLRAAGYEVVNVPTQ
jgi:hypothetical protein